ncbi:zf-CCHC domain-containing protein, partial [Tanacetum coccineum]
MDSNKYLEGQSMQRLSLFESDCFLYWKNRFETYVKAKDLDLWHIIMNGDFPRIAKNEVTQILEVVPFEQQTDELKKKLAKNNEAKMVMAIEELKDLSSLALDELIGNLKVHELFMEKVSKIYNGKKERVKSIALIAKKESSDDEISTSRSDDEEYAIISERKCFRCGDPNHLIGDCPKPPRNKDQKAFVGGCWSDSENEAEDKTNDENCLMAQSTNYVCLRTCLKPGEWIKDTGCSKHMTGNKSLFLTYKAYDGSNVVFGSNLKRKDHRQ